MFGVILAAARFFKPELCKRYAPPRIALAVGVALVASAVVLFSIRGPLEGTNLFLVFQAQLGSVAGFPLVSVGIALILGAMLDLEQVLRRLPVPGAVVVATLSYSLYLTHKSAFHVDKLIFGEENLPGRRRFRGLSGHELRRGDRAVVLRREDLPYPSRPRSLLRPLT